MTDPLPKYYIVECNEELAPVWPLKLVGLAWEVKDDSVEEPYLSLTMLQDVPKELPTGMLTINELRAGDVKALLEQWNQKRRYT